MDINSLNEGSGPRKVVKKNTILVVDDYNTNIIVFRRILSNDYHIIEADNGLSALELAETDLPDLIILDIMMPGMDGYEICSRLKEIPATKNIPVLFVTSLHDTDDEERGFSVGAVDYIIKPFRPRLLKARVNTHMALKLYADELDQIASIDEPTGLSNRRMFNGSLGLEWRRAYRNAQSLVVIMIDIDYFKQFNDLYGHLAGDDCLRAVAEILHTSSRRPGDVAARYGGDEFVMLLPDTDIVGAKNFGDSLCCTISALNIKHEYSPHNGIVTVSVGVSAIFPSNDTSAISLISLADEALYEAKVAGRNRMAWKIP